MTVKGCKAVFWSDKDIQFLKNNYKYMSQAEIAKELNKTPSATGNKAKRMGFIRKSKYNNYIVNEELNFAEIDIYNKYGDKTTSFKIDLDDLETIMQYKWSLHVCGYITTNQGNILLHRFLMKPPINMAVDHINGDKLDNRRYNLRVVTIAENNANIRVAYNELSIVGVFKSKKSKKYYTTINVRKESIRLGTFDTIQETQQVYNFAKAYALLTLGKH